MNWKEITTKKLFKSNSATNITHVSGLDIDKQNR